MQAMQDIGAQEAGFAAMLGEEWAALVRWCAHLVGNRDVAEDLAQEAVSAAWRSTRRPATAAEYAPWLRGIARHQCLTWLRRQRRELARCVTALPDAGTESAPFIDPFDPQVALEQTELARLVERALALLPATTRRIMIAKYIEGTPLAEIAAQVQLTESATAARLQRGKAAARQLLLTQLSEDADGWGFVRADTVGWRTTRLWCPDCGGEHLQAHLSSEQGTLRLRCPTCLARNGHALATWEDSALLRGLTSVRAALSRLSAWGHAYYRAGIAQGTARCAICGAPDARVAVEPLSLADGVTDPSVVARCRRCRGHALASLDGVALCHPLAQRFWRDEGRIRTLPRRAGRWGERDVAVVSFVGMRSSQQLDLLIDPATLDVVQHVRGHHG